MEKVNNSYQWESSGRILMWDSVSWLHFHWIVHNHLPRALHRNKKRLPSRLLIPTDIQILHKYPHNHPHTDTLLSSQSILPSLLYLSRIDTNNIISKADYICWSYLTYRVYHIALHIPSINQRISVQPIPSLRPYIPDLHIQIKHHRHQ